jgi:hypothetical protein
VLVTSVLVMLEAGAAVTRHRRSQAGG